MGRLGRAAGEIGLSREAPGACIVIGESILPHPLPPGRLPANQGFPCDPLPLPSKKPSGSGLSLLSGEAQWVRFTLLVTFLFSL